MDEAAIENQADQLIALMNELGVSRLVAEFEHRANEEPKSAVAGYELYRAWDHGRGGNLYVEHTHEYVPGDARPGGLKPLCRQCGEGPLDGDHYGEGENREAEVVDACRALLDLRFAEAASAAGTLKADAESLRVWADVRHETSGEQAARLRVEL